MPSNSRWLSSNTNKTLDMRTLFNGYYKLNYTSVSNLNSYVNNFLDGDFAKLFTDVDGCITALTFYPFDVEPLLDVDTLGLKLELGPFGADTNVKAVNLNLGSRYFNMGEFYVDENLSIFDQNFSDYNGYSKIQIYLPYFGLIDVNPNDVLGKYLQFRLSVDFGTAQGIWFVGVSDTPYQSEAITDPYVRILATYSCTIGYKIPFASSGANETIRNLVLGAVKTATFVAGQYAASALIPSTTTTSKTVKTYDIQGRSTAKGSKMKQIRSGSVTSERSTTTDVSAQTTRNVVNACFDSAGDALSAMHMSMSSDRVNNIAGLINGCESIKIIIYHPIMKPVTDDYAKLYGYPLGEVRILGNISGYTEISSIHIEGQEFSTATSEEFSKLYSLLTSGIIL